MQRSSALSLLAFFAAISASATSRAQTTDDEPSRTVAEAPHPEIDRREQRPLAVMAVLGGGTPVGAVGLVVEYSPAPYFVVSGGAGMSDGLQLALTPRFELPLSRTLSLGIGGGLSTGKYVQQPFWCFDCEIHRTTEWSRAYWGNGEISLDGISKRGFAFRTFVGLGQLLNPTPDRCTEQSVEVACAGGEKKTRLVYAGVALGYAF
jgi:hypothetical protein